MSLVVLTKSPVRNFGDIRKKCKLFVKFLSGQKRGQDLVTDSLKKGLEEIGYIFSYNSKVDEINPEDVVYVNASYDALRWAINAKKNNKIKKLIVGPVMVVSPTDKNSIICDPHVDSIIVPSQWVKDFWISLVPELEERIIIWASGVDVYALPPAQEKNRVLLYKKNGDETLFNNIVNFLDKNNILYDIITYGYYTHRNYLHLLDKAKVLIFISESESQGLALCEAWMKDVPTLVWNRGHWAYAGNYWEDKKISAPYLNEKSGLFFKDSNNFVDVWNIFLSGAYNFSPREYAKSHFSNKIVAENFIKLIK